MWKIKSRHREATVWQALKNELGPVYQKTNGKMKEFLEAHPKMILALMIILIIASSVIAVIINQRQPKAGIPKMQTQQSLQDINRNFGELQEIQLRQEEIEYWTLVIEGIIKKESISPQDSILVETAIKELEILNNYDDENRF